MFDLHVPHYHYERGRAGVAAHQQIHSDGGLISVDVHENDASQRMHKSVLICRALISSAYIAEEPLSKTCQRRNIDTDRQSDNCIKSTFVSL